MRTGSAPSSLLLSSVSLVAILTSTASSTTRFMNSSKPYSESAGESTQQIYRTYADLALDADGKLLIQPDLHGRVGLQKLEDEVDGGQQDSAATASSSAGHCVFGGCLRAAAGMRGWGSAGLSCFVVVVVVMVVVVVQLAWCS